MFNAVNYHILSLYLQRLSIRRRSFNTIEDEPKKSKKRVRSNTISSKYVKATCGVSQISPDVVLFFAKISLG